MPLAGRILGREDGDGASGPACVVLRWCGRRVGGLGRLDELIVPLVTARAPRLLALHGVGPDTAALLLIAADDHPGRLRSEAAWAHLCAVARIPASSGKSPATGSIRRQPRGQPCPVADRDHPDELACPDAGLRRAAHRARPVEEGDHPRPEALRHTRGLPPPAPRLTPQTRGRPDPLIGCRIRAGLLTIRRPSPSRPALLGVTS
jgi:Transposase IS116/IS110/IS902 family